MLTTDELMTVFTALRGATEAAAKASADRGEDKDTSREYKRSKAMLDKVKQAMG